MTEQKTPYDAEIDMLRRHETKITLLETTLLEGLWDERKGYRRRMDEEAAGTSGKPIREELANALRQCNGSDGSVATPRELDTWAVEWADHILATCWPTEQRPHATSVKPSREQLVKAIEEHPVGSYITGAASRALADHLHDHWPTQPQPALDARVERLVEAAKVEALVEALGSLLAERPPCFSAAPPVTCGQCDWCVAESALKEMESA